MVMFAQYAEVNRESCSLPQEPGLGSDYHEGQEVNIWVHMQPAIHLQGTGEEALPQKDQSKLSNIWVYQRKKVKKIPNKFLRASRHKHIKVDVLRKINPLFQLP